jgi:hypothetical protein
MKNVLFAIDPGVTGAIAEFRGGELAVIHDPGPRGLGRGLASLIWRVPFVPLVVVEQVNGMPGQSGPAAFNFGQGYGELLGVCVARGVEPVLVRPSVWKAALGLRRGVLTQRQFNALSLEKARALWPDATWFTRVKDEGRAEAALLGHWYLTHG